MMKQRFLQTVLLMFQIIFVAGCVSDPAYLLPTETSVPTPSEIHRPEVAESSAFPTTEETMGPVIKYQLTFSTASRDGYFGLFAIDVGCLDEGQLCVGSPELLFERQSDGQGFPPIFKFDWHPDGHLIAMDNERISNRGDIVIADWDGQNEVNLSQTSGPDRSPIWSPDGSRVYFATRDENFTFRVISVPINGVNGMEILPIPSEVTPLDFEFFPDGTRLIMGGSESSGPVQGLDQIYLAEMSGELTRLTQVATNYYSPSISPDGHFIAYIREIDPNTPGYDFEIYLMDLSTLAESPLEVEFPEENFLDEPTWAPFGDWLAFTVRKEDGSESIYLSKPNGSGLTLLYESPSFIMHMSWRTLTVP